MAFRPKTNRPDSVRPLLGVIFRLSGLGFRTDAASGFRTDDGGGASGGGSHGSRGEEWGCETGYIPHIMLEILVTTLQVLCSHALVNGAFAGLQQLAHSQNGWVSENRAAGAFRAGRSGVSSRPCDRV